MGEINFRRTFLGGLIADGQQTDVAHMVDFAHTGLPFNFARPDSHGLIHQDKRITHIPECISTDQSYEENLECEAEHYFGSWFDSIATANQTTSSFADHYFGATEDEEMSIPFPDSTIESLMICPAPNIASTGAHRVVAVFWMSGERYAAVFEEGGSFLDTKGENVYVDGLTPGADERVRNFIFIEGKLIPSIVLAMTGHQLYAPAHNFVIDIFDPATPPEDPNHTGQWDEGCRPSKRMYHY